MRLAKSLFITLHLTLLAAVLAAGGVIQLTGGPDLAWLGAMATALPGALFFAWLFLGHVPRTAARLPGWSAAHLPGLGLATWGVLDAGADLLPLAAALASALGWLVYESWYSRLDRTPSPALARGEKLPPLTLETPDGEPVPAGRFAGSPTVYLFYRGNWCPLCTAQVEDAVGAWREIAARGARLALISPQPAEHTRRLASRFDVPFELLVDPQGANAARLGLTAVHGTPAGLDVLGYDRHAVLPTVLVTDADGRIAHAFEPDNYRDRPTVPQILEALDALGHRAATPA